MLSNEEKQEMLIDAKSDRRRSDFRSGAPSGIPRGSIDEYIDFLDSVQKIFSPFKISTKPTLAKFNKL